MKILDPPRKKRPVHTDMRHREELIFLHSVI